MKKMNTIDSLKNFGRKELVGGLMLGSLGIGCGKNDEHINYTEQPTEKNLFKYEFSNFGEVSIPPQLIEMPQMKIADLDGDGDLDLIFAARSLGYFERVFIFENKMPQKNK